MKISAHMMVKNEDQWIWYSLMSVLSVVDEIIIIDTGSTDQTIPIIRSITSPKIKLTERQISQPQDLTTCRQDMLSNTSAEWVFFVDGDEVWPPQALSESLTYINSSSLSTLFLVNRFRNLVGDVYHYQEEAAGKYHIGSLTGHLTLRFIHLSQTGPLAFAHSYPQESLVSKSGQPLQNSPSSAFKVINSPYLHFTHLRRSSQVQDEALNRRGKIKKELGLPMEKDFHYPMSFYLPHRPIVPSPWTRRSPSFILKSLPLSPLQFIHRHL